MDYRITKEYDGTVLKQYLYGTLHLSTRILKRLKYRSDGRGILQNGEPVTVRAILREGDVLSLALDDAVSSENVIPSVMDLPILYEDDDLIVVNKPPHMPTHPTHGHLGDTVANALAAYYAEQGRPFVFRCGSRLDRDTSGVLPIAKNQQTANYLYRCHRTGKIAKEYDLIVSGRPDPAQGEISLPIRRMDCSVIMRIAGDGGVTALTRYHTVRTVPDQTLGEISLVRATLLTGRTHQLRVHFAAIGCPVAGDTLYGPEQMEKFPRQAVHAAKISFAHPVTGVPLTFAAPLPPDLSTLLPGEEASE